MKVAIIALKYEESYWQQQTLPSLEKIVDQYGCDLVLANRDGVGNMSRAFNQAVKDYEEINWSTKPDAYWFVTNIVTAPYVYEELTKALELGYAAVHPAFCSDHHHIVPNGSGEIMQVPFIEFTAPMISSDYFFSLDEDHWYYYMDLILSKQIKDCGGKMAVHHGAIIDHTYLRLGQKEPITKLREKLRKYREPIEHEILTNKFGPNWREVLWDYQM